MRNILHRGFGWVNAYWLAPARAREVCQGRCRKRISILTCRFYPHDPEKKRGEQFCSRDKMPSARRARHYEGPSTFLARPKTIRPRPVELPACSPCSLILLVRIWPRRCTICCPAVYFPLAYVMHDSRELGARGYSLYYHRCADASLTAHRFRMTA